METGKGRPGYRFAHPGYASCSGRAGPNVPGDRRPVFALHLGSDRASPADLDQFHETNRIWRMELKHTQTSS